MVEMVYNCQSVEPQPIMVVAVVEDHSLMLLHLMVLVEDILVHIPLQTT